MSGLIYLVPRARARARSSCGTRCASTRDYSDALARQTFRYSIVYLSLLFAALLVDHYSAASAVTLASILSLRRCSRRGCCWPRCDRPAAPRQAVPARPTSPAPTSARTSSLTDHNGKPRTLADFRGKVVVVFFGYTQCPDVCPTTLAELARGDEAARRGRRARCRCCSSRSIRSATRPRCSRQYVPALRSRASRLHGDADADRAHARRSSRCSTRRCRARPPAATRVDHTAGTLRLRPAGPAAPVRALRQRRARRSRTTSELLLAERLSLADKPRRRRGWSAERAAAAASVRRQRASASSACASSSSPVASIWRMRSAETPNSAARSCSVAASCLAQPARLDDAAAARDRGLPAPAPGLRLRRRSLSLVLEDAAGLVLGVGQVGDRARKRLRRRRPPAPARRPARTGAFPSRPLPRA